jgi:hypothetical protein
MAGIQRGGLNEVALHFAALEDPRSTVNRQHPLVNGVVIALLAVRAGCQWANSDRQVGGIERRVPRGGVEFTEWNSK